MEAQQGRQLQQREGALWELQLAAAGVELEVWAASVVGGGAELKGQQVEAAWVAAWVMEPGVSLQGAL